ncbi:hypothetical protein VYU27_007485 [Nannochloropsis oceanica]
MGRGLEGVVAVVVAAVVVVVGMRTHQPERGGGGGGYSDRESSSSNNSSHQTHLLEHSSFGALALTHAISLGDSDALMKVIDSGIPISVLGSGAALHLLARNAASLEAPSLLLLLTLLLQHGAGADGGIDALDEEGLSPLHRCVALSLPPAVSLLLDYKADINLLSPPPSTSSPLHIAAQRKDEEMCLLLLGRGARGEERDGKGKTPGDYFPELAVLTEGNEKRKGGEREGGGGEASK